ncbi:MAG: DUF4298 domain-containing protein [Clostridia bacterium]|nr:DUF4298 domain-containing protein [Clostridia bacterium]
MNRVERITYYENLMSNAQKTLADFETALQEFSSAQKSLSELGSYLKSRQWMNDFEAYENGKLPSDLACGVLSEDGIFNLLEKNTQLLHTACNICANPL